MNKRLSSAVSRVIRFLSFAAAIIVLPTACRQKPQQIVNEQSNAYYTCSMHPQVHESHPGNCPVCGMKLIKVELTGSANTTGNRITLTEAQIRLAGIQTDTVREENTADEKTLTGTVTTDENEDEELSARTAGRVQRLFIRTTGEKVAIGQPVYAIYSEDLLAAEKEYLLAIRQQKELHNPDVDYAMLINAAKNKLQLWGLSKQQIRNITISEKASPTVDILSTVSGTVSEIAVHEGDYVAEGMTILKTQRLNNLWVEAQLYAGEAANYKLHGKVNVSFPDLEGKMVNGTIEFINPELSEGSKVDLIRISIPNSQGLIRPGMLANIDIAYGQKRTLAVPASAILVDGRGSTVWIKNSDGSFSPKMVSVSTGNQAYIPVLSGLNRGDIVVTNGAYLLNSEAIFKNGNNTSMGNMKM